MSRCQTSRQSRVGSPNQFSPGELAVLSPTQYRRPRTRVEWNTATESFALDAVEISKGQRRRASLAPIRFLSSCFASSAGLTMLPDGAYYFATGTENHRPITSQRKPEKQPYFSHGHTANRACSVPSCQLRSRSRSLRGYDGPLSDESSTSSPLVQSEPRLSPPRCDYPGYIASPPNDGIDRVDWAHQCLIRKALESLTDTKPSPKDRCHPSNLDGMESARFERPGKFTRKGSILTQSRRIMNRTAMVSCPELHKSGDQYLNPDVITEEVGAGVPDEEVEKKRAAKKSKQRATSHGQADAPVGFRETITQSLRLIGSRFRRPPPQNTAVVRAASPADGKERRRRARELSSESDGMPSTSPLSPGRSPGVKRDHLPYSAGSPASGSPIASTLAVAGMMTITGELDRLSNAANRSAENTARSSPAMESPAAPGGPQAPPNTPASQINDNSGTASPQMRDSSRGGPSTPTVQLSPATSGTLTPTTTKPIPIPGSLSPKPSRRRVTRSRMSEMFSMDDTKNPSTRYTTVFDDYSQSSLDIGTDERAIEGQRSSTNERRRSYTLTTIIIDDKASEDVEFSSSTLEIPAAAGDRAAAHSIDGRPTSPLVNDGKSNSSLLLDQRIRQLGTAAEADDKAHDATSVDADVPGKSSSIPRHGISGVLSSLTSELRRHTPDLMKSKTPRPGNRMGKKDELKSGKSKHKARSGASAVAREVAAQRSSKDASKGFIQHLEVSSGTPPTASQDLHWSDDNSSLTEPVDHEQDVEQPADAEEDDDGRMLRRNTTGTVHIMAVRKKALGNGSSSDLEDTDTDTDVDAREAPEIARHVT